MALAYSSLSTAQLGVELACVGAQLEMLGFRNLTRAEREGSLIGLRSKLGVVEGALMARLAIGAEERLGWSMIAKSMRSRFDNTTPSPAKYPTAPPPEEAAPTAAASTPSVEPPHAIEADCTAVTAVTPATPGVAMVVPPVATSSTATTAVSPPPPPPPVAADVRDVASAAGDPTHPLHHHHHYNENKTVNGPPRGPQIPSPAGAAAAGAAWTINSVAGGLSSSGVTAITAARSNNVAAACRDTEVERLLQAGKATTTSTSSRARDVAEGTETSAATRVIPLKTGTAGQTNMSSSPPASTVTGSGAPSAASESFAERPKASAPAAHLSASAAENPVMLAASRAPPENLRQHSPGDNPQGLAFASSLKGEGARGSKAMAVKEEYTVFRRPGKPGANDLTRGRYRKRRIMSAFSIMGEADMEGWGLPLAVAAAVTEPRPKRRRMPGRAPAKCVKPPSSSRPPSDAVDDAEMRKRVLSPSKKSALLGADALAPSVVNSRAGILYPCNDTTVCYKAALFGRPEFQTPSFCPLHKIRGMKLLVTCQESGCRERAMFGHIRGRPSTFCRKHKGVDMVDVSKPTCFAAGCESMPVFGFKTKDKRATACRAHKDVGMVNVKVPSCDGAGCDVTPAFGFKTDRKPTRCSLHQFPGMRNLTLPECISCERTAYYGSLDGTLKRTHCGKCRMPEMVKKTKH